MYMNNVKHLLTVTAVWTSIVYTACYVAIWLFPGVRDIFLTTALHAQVPLTSGPFTIGTFVAGLVVWNVITALGVWLFAYLYRTIRA